MISHNHLLPPKFSVICFSQQVLDILGKLAGVSITYIEVSSCIVDEEIPHLESYSILKEVSFLFVEEIVLHLKEKLIESSSFE